MHGMREKPGATSLLRVSLPSCLPSISALILLQFSGMDRPTDEKQQGYRHWHYLSILVLPPESGYSMGPFTIRSFEFRHLAGFQFSLNGFGYGIDA